MAPRAPVLALLVALPIAGCRDRARPWEGSTATAQPTETAFLAPQPSDAGSLLGDAASLLGASADTEPGIPVRVGGPWVRCYGNFRPSGEPVKDVTRLALLCGPENGMVRLSKKPIEGAVAEPSAAPAPSESFAAVQGECYRIFAVAETSVGDLDVAVRSSRGVLIAADHGEDNWPIVQPDRPFCALENDTFTVEFTSHRGWGRFAAEVWRLGPRRAD